MSDVSVQTGARILIMDDEEGILEVTCEILTTFGYVVEGAIEGQEALRKYQAALQEGKKFDLVVMDLNIRNGLGGKEAIKALLTLDPRAKVIVSSGRLDDPMISDYRDYGFVGVMPKPYKMDELEVIIRKALAT